MPQDQENTVRRRTVMQRSAWAVPVIAAAVATPLAAASAGCAITTTLLTYTGAPQTVTVPVNAKFMDYTVRGAGGGGEENSDRGFGAETTGRVTFDGPGSPRTFTVIVGEGGEVVSDGSTAEGGWGYGQGGSSTTGPRVSQAKTGGGGGGSAILLSDPALTPLVVAGGGGGSAVAHVVQGSTDVVQTLSSPTFGFDYGTANAGSTRNGRAAGVGQMGTTVAALAPSPALAGVGTVGGQGGGGSSYMASNGDWSGREISAGSNGGAFGTGLHGGGNGGNGSPRLSNGLDIKASGGGGGGGYSGGGGGGMVAAHYQTNALKSVSAGSGAAGTSYSSGNSNGLQNANNGLTNSGLPTGPNRGHPGIVRLEWCV